MKLTIPVFIFLASFIVYFMTAARLPVNIADSNELMTAAFTRGIAHPPSYPLYVGFLYVVMHLPFIPSPAFAANLTSALFQSLSLVTFYLCSVELVKLTKFNKNRLLVIGASLIGTFTLAFSFFFWDQATYAEVFGLHNLFTGLLLLLILKDRKFNLTYLISGLFGFAASHHQIIVLLIPAYYFFSLRKSKQNLFVHILVFALTFILPYLLLFVFNRMEAPLSWSFDPSISGLWQVISRSVFAVGGESVPMPAFNIGQFIQSILSLFRYVVSHLSLPAILIAFFGLVYLRQKKSSLFWFFGISLLISGPFLAAYMKFPIPGDTEGRAYFYSTYLSLRMFHLFEYILALMIPLGILYLISLKRIVNNIWMRYGLLLGAALIPVYLGFHNFSIVDKRESNFDQVFYTTLLTGLPVDSMLIVDSDAVFGLLYAQNVSLVRQDVLIVPMAMHMRWGYLKQYLPPEIFEISGYYRLTLSLTDWGLSRYQHVFVFNPHKPFVNQLEAFKYFLTPTGYVLEISREPKEITAHDYGLSYQLTRQTTPKEDLWSLFGRAELGAIHETLAHYYAQLGQAEGAATHLSLARELGKN